MDPPRYSRPPSTQRTPPRIGTWNVTALTSQRLDFLHQSSREAWAPDIWCLQEVKLRTDDVVRLTSLSQLGSLHHTPRPPKPGSTHCSGGLAIVVNRHAYDLAATEDGSTLSRGVRLDWNMVDVVDSHCLQRFRIVNVYAVPGSTMDIAGILEDLHVTLQPDVIAGDFNARHITWSPPTTSNTRAADSYARGGALYRWISARGYYRSNEGLAFTPTTVPHAGTSQTALDFFLLGRRMVPSTHWVHSGIGRSIALSPGDHFPVILNVPSNTHAVPTRRQRRIKWGSVDPTQLRMLRRTITESQDMTTLETSLRSSLSRLPRTGWRSRSSAPMMVDSDVHDANAAWRLLKRVYNTVPPVVPIYLSSDVAAVPLIGPRAKATALNTLFANKHTARSVPPPEPPLIEGVATYCMEVPPILAWEVSAAIKQLKNNKAMDNQGFSAELLKTCRSALLHTLPTLFTHILQNPQSMPAAWRQVTIVPLLKAGKDPSLGQSFRPVCITSHFSRLMERILACRLIVALQGQLSSRQYGYVPGRSPLDAACVILGTAATISKIYRNRRKGVHDPPHQVHGKTLIGYLDLSDAFCRVPHRILLHRLTALGVPEYIRCFIRLWLWDRTARTYVDGRYSAPARHYAGVPQGSVLGPLLFSVFIDTIVQSTHQRIVRKLATPTATYAVIAAYVDDVTILVGGLDPDRIYSLITDLVQHFYTWCTRNDMELSSKSVFQWVYPTWNSITTTVNRYGGTLPPILVRRNTQEPPVLQLVNGRLAKTSASNMVCFETHKAITQRHLGIVVDHKLTFAAHLAERRAALDSFHARLLPYSKHIHPRAARTLVLGMAQSALYGLPLLFPSAEPRVLQPVQTAWASLVKRAGQIVQLAAHADSLIEMGCPSMSMMVSKLAITWNHKRHCLPIQLEPIYINILPDWLDEATCPAAALLIDPAAIFGHPPLTGNPLPFRYPVLPLPTVLDKVHFPQSAVTQPLRTVKRPADELRALNTHRRREVYDRLSGYTVHEGWSDGSVTYTGKESEDKAGGAAVIFHPGFSHTRVWISENSPVPLHACSYTAEVFAALTLLDILTRLTSKRATEKVAVLICSDSLSWITNVGRGPTSFGPIAPLFWSKLAILSQQVDAIEVVHCYSHCADPRGDIVDEAAKAAGQLNIRTLTPWHVDMARAATAVAWKPLVHTIVKEQRSTFHRGMHPNMETWIPSIKSVPPLLLHVKQSAMILQLRTGIWPSLGAHTFIRAALAPHLCTFCQQEITPEHGMPVVHLLTCPQTATSTNPLTPAQALWSPKVDVLRSLIQYALQFIPQHSPSVPVLRQRDGRRFLASPPSRHTISPLREEGASRPSTLCQTPCSQGAWPF
ncbi:Endonuclease/Exonuclease/phosphatase family/Endonuclease-reverse transcriptase [Leishmania shawi]|uniref:Endonuclease/Exonuclease/phosphatase family/Endonuclease-reverse transcriptase n=1 Tax=Leishmania shawi TaxID=5680 RepID=A0AAW3CDU2_9TRYP